MARQKIEKYDFYEASRRGDLWMIKTIYLVYLLRKIGVDIWWILQFKDKEAIFEGIERLQKELKDDGILD